MLTATKIIALGSTFAAGPGILPVANPAAGRSRLNYPNLLARSLSADLIDATTSGATTEQILTSPHRLGGRIVRPQIEAVAPDADLVTITAGGRDAGYVVDAPLPAIVGLVAKHTVARVLPPPVRKRVNGDAARAAEHAAAGLIEAVAAVRARARHARVVLVDYLTVVGPHAEPSRELPLTAADIEWFRRRGEILAHAFRIASERGRAELVVVSGLSLEHGIGSPDPWVDGVEAPLGLAVTAPFRPNEAGMRAVADAILVQVT